MWTWRLPPAGAPLPRPFLPARLRRPTRETPDRAVWRKASPEPWGLAGPAEEARAGEHPESELWTKRNWVKSVIITVHQGQFTQKFYIFPLISSGIYPSELFWRGLLSFKDISQRDFRSLSKITEVGGTQRAETNRFEKPNSNVSTDVSVSSWVPSSSVTLERSQTSPKLCNSHQNNQDGQKAKEEKCGFFSSGVNCSV